ncbi:MAG: imidazole glycerol phosphate synthase subunit HisF [Arenicella sp.]
MIRVIGRLDVKGRRLIKGVQYEGVRVLGDALDYAKNYYSQGVDELIYIDAVASLYGRPSMGDLLIDTVQEVFVPVTAGGGVSSVEDVKSLLSSGADKVAINTSAVKTPTLISDVADKFGSQCMVLSVQAKKITDGKWEAYVECGREKTGLDVLEWAVQAESLGAGEILLSSIDRDGTAKGGDLELVNMISTNVGIPVIASSGLGSVNDVTDVVESGKADAIAIGKALHFEELTIDAVKQVISEYE